MEENSWRHLRSEPGRQTDAPGEDSLEWVGDWFSMEAELGESNGDSTMTATSINISMAEIQVIKGPGAFKVASIGGGIAICALDPVANVAGCAYFVLPEVVNGQSGDRPGKHATSAIPELLAMMERMGAKRAQIVASAIGGTQFFKVGGEEAESSFEIGTRNIEATRQMLAECGLKMAFEDFGGNLARTVMFSTGGGDLFVRTQGGRDKLAANLRRQAVRI